ncbi:hypothetical protein [Bacillus sp. 3255]|nr:hypothetical protein [Bacillus sp. 3255]MDR6884752.1 hypothetical protein [Bacillus sp. 3255]
MSDVIIYDSSFDANEWFVLAILAAGVVAIWLLPRRFTMEQALFNLLTGIVLGLMLDHTLALPPFDLYDVGDESTYSLFDMFSYAMYAPYGYLFIYIYKRWRIKGLYTIPYILVWSLVSVGIEWLSVKVGVFHYKNGYHLNFSFPIYLFLQSMHVLLFRSFFPDSFKKK